MIIALLARNLRHQRSLILALALGLAGLEVTIIQLTAAIEAGPGLRDLVQMMPPAIRQLAGSQLGMTSFPAAVAFGFQHPAVLVAAVAFIIVASTIPAGECETGTLDLLLARPIPRGQYLLGSLAVVLLGSAFFPAALLTGSVVGLALVDAPGELHWSRYLMSAVSFSTLLLALGGFTLLIAAGATRRGPAVARAVGVILVLYLVEFLAEFWSGLEWFRWISPFHYYKPISAAVASHTPIQNPLALLAMFSVMTALAFVRFNRRDV